MKLIFIGSGSAFTVGDNNYQSNILIVNEKSERLLIDCGSDARLALYDLGLSYKDIDSVYISHLHADHVGGLEWLAINRYFQAESPKPTLYISQSQVDKLWNQVLSGGLNPLGDEPVELASFFKVKPVEDHGNFSWDGLVFTLVQTLHILSNHKPIPSFGLFVKINGHQVFITTDTQFSPDQLSHRYHAADIIFHDCETSDDKSDVHSHYDQLCTLDPAIKAKMWLYHYNPGPLPNAKKDGFRGFVKKGQCFDFSKPETLIAISTSSRGL